MFERWAEKFKSKKVQEEEIEFKNFDEGVKTAPKPTEPTPSYNVAPASIEGNIELKVVRPVTFEDVSGIADYLIEGCTVVLNLELLDQASTIRMLDFLNGVTYSMDGEIKNVSRSTYIITPNNVDVSDN